MMESLSVTGFKRFSLGWTKSDLYVLYMPTVPLQKLYYMLCCSAGSRTQYGSNTVDSSGEAYPGLLSSNDELMKSIWLV